MFFPGTSNVFLPDDSVFILLKCMCNNILIEKKMSRSYLNYFLVIILLT